MADDTLLIGLKKSVFLEGIFITSLISLINLGNLLVSNLSITSLGSSEVLEVSEVFDVEEFKTSAYSDT